MPLEGWRKSHQSQGLQAFSLPSRCFSNPGYWWVLESTLPRYLFFCALTIGPACSTQATTRDWLLQFFGKFCTEAPYTQLVSLYHQPFDAVSLYISRLPLHSREDVPEKMEIQLPRYGVTELNSSVFLQYAILDFLTPTQIGDMMVYSDTLTRMDAAVQLVQFFQQSEAEDVQMILTQFTRAASMVDTTHVLCNLYLPCRYLPS